MKLPVDLSRAAEHGALHTLPANPPLPAGLARYLAQLAADRHYRASLGAALVLAFTAGTDFGLSAPRTPLKFAWWAATAAVLGGHILLPQTIGARPNFTPRAWFAMAAALAAGWVTALAIFPRTQANVAASLVCAIAIIGFDRVLALRPAFANAVAILIFIHVGGLALFATGAFPLWAQIGAATIEGGLVVYAGFRDTAAAVLKLPLATYRIAPLCVVSRLERAQDHPVRIDVA